jgi:hypothetical protein
LSFVDRRENKEEGGKTMEEKKTGVDFDPKSMGEEVLKFMKSSFEATFDNVIKIQDLNEKMLKEMAEKGKEMQSETAKAVEDFIENSKKGRDDYRKVVEDGFKRMEEMLKEEK